MLPLNIAIGRIKNGWLLTLQYNDGRAEAVYLSTFDACLKYLVQLVGDDARIYEVASSAYGKKPGS
jgi:hypothetical protein